MTQIIRQNATTKVRVGPAAGISDALPVSSLTLGSADAAVAILSDDSVVDISGYTMAAVTGADGMYDLTLQAGITDTVGILDIYIRDDSLVLPIRESFQVVEESVYDRMFAASAVGPLTAAEANAEVDTALSDIGLDHLVSAAVTGTDIADDSIIASLVSSSATADWDDYDNTTDAMQALRDRGDAAWTTGAGGSPPDLLQDTTIATLSSQTEFTLTAGSADNDAYNGAVAVIIDQSTSTQKAVGTVSDYVGSTKTVTLSADPGIFTMAAGDTIKLIASTGSGGGGLDAAGVRAAVGLTSANLDTQLGAIQTDVTAILADTNELQTDDVPGLIAGLSIPTVAAIADAVWDEDIETGHSVPASAAVVLFGIADDMEPNFDTVIMAINGLNDPTVAAIADAVWDEDIVAAHTTDDTAGKILSDGATITNNVVVTQQDIDAVYAPPGTNVITRGTQFSAKLEGIPSITGATAIYYGIKVTDEDDDDALMIVRLPLNGAGGATGLTVLNGAPPASSSDAVIAHSTYTEGSDTFHRFVCTVEGEATAAIPTTVEITQTQRLGYTRSKEKNGYFTGWKLVGDNDQAFERAYLQVYPDTVKATS